MFNLSTQEVVLSIEKTPVIGKNKIFYQEYANFFGNTLLNKIKNEIKKLKLVKLEDQEDYERGRADYNESICKELKLFFSNLKIRLALENKFQIALKFNSVDVWEDYNTFDIPPHVDNEKIKLALQIYLGDEDNAGTSLFETNDKSSMFHTFKYKCNNGYALLNTKNSFHGIEFPVKNNVRTSMYVRYQ